ncbi:MAG: hypothetical protein V7K69_33100 [Nostoc sp.]
MSEGGVGGWGRNLAPHTPPSLYTQKPVKSRLCAYLSAIRYWGLMNSDRNPNRNYTS